MRTLQLLNLLCITSQALNGPFRHHYLRFQEPDTHQVSLSVIIRTSLIYFLINVRGDLHD